MIIKLFNLSSVSNIFVNMGSFSRIS